MWQQLFAAGAGLLCLAGPVSARNEVGPANPCPIPCSVAGPSPLNWTYLHGIEALNRCDEPMLFSMMLSNRLNDPERHTTIRACMASEQAPVQDEISIPKPFAFGQPEERSVSTQKGQQNQPSCASDMRMSLNQTTLYYHEWLTDPGSTVDGNIEDTTMALGKLEEYIEAVDDNCKTSFMFAKTRQTIVGLFAGSLVGKQSAALVVGRLANFIKDKEDYEAGRIAVQKCRGTRPSVWGLGVVADLQGNVTAVQESLAGWRDAKCVESPDMNTVWMKTDVEIRSIEGSLSTNRTIQSGNSTLTRRADDTCRAELVEPGDDCWTVAQRCGITMANFNKFNPAKDLCDPLQAKQYVCCSAGELPDFRPQPDAKGNCHSVDIEEGDECWLIADAHFLKVDDIEKFNKETWGFAGCDDLQAGQKICLSKGEPPMPNTISNAICGPQMPNGEARGSKKLADMNPCPLNVCCNIWGQCGMDGDFCTEAPAKNGAPGTSKPGANGCISNCGLNITNNKEGPSSFSHIAYFEAWNKERDCLHMDVTDIDTKKYTHIHFSFPDVTPGDFQVDVSKLQDQFDLMKTMKGIKRIVSLGGWANSAELPNYYIMREAVMPQNRAKFVANMVSFVNEHGLDGIDIDWEYPGAENLGEGVPPGSPDEGSNYLETLKMLKRRLGNKSVSIAAPASYWYLRGFPIKEIGQVVDYIVYMTYDLHGQWDYGNKWSSHGCENGNCLRSHVNLTETMTALAMVTKAGVPSKKVFVGIASYARSFKMARAGCTGPDCTYTGSATSSDAKPGVCTETSGYIASAEIREILWNKDVLASREWHDRDSDSDIVVYQDTEWLAWMNDKTKSSRIDHYKGLNFGGVSDWAVDLDKDYGDSGIGSGDPNDSSLSGGRNCPLGKTYKDMEQLAGDDDVADDCKPVLALGILERILDDALDLYDDVDNGYDKNFKAYQRVMKEAAKEAMFKFTKWRDGPYTEWFDCDFKDLDNSRRNWKGPCDEMADHVDAWLEGVMVVELTMRDEEGFYEALEEETGIISDWVDFGKIQENTEPGASCNPPPPPGQICTPITYILSVTGIPKLKDDFEIPDPKDLIKDVTGNLEEIRDGIAGRFFDVVAGIWDGGNGDVLQVYSVPVFLLAQAVDSMEEAKKQGGEIIKQEKEALIFHILSALLFFIPFAGQFAAMAAGAATVARLIALAGMVGNTAFSIAEIAGNPENAAMAVMALLSAGRVRKPRDFIDLGAARRAQTRAGVARMGDTFQKHDDSLQKVLGNCRKEGGKDDDEPNMCLTKRDVDDGFSDLLAPDSHDYLFGRAEESFFGLPVLNKRQASGGSTNKKNCGTTVHSTTTTSTEMFYTTPAKTCSAKWAQACYHYSSVMSVNTNNPDMVRWTCWATDGTSQDGKATDDWGMWNTQTKKSLPRTAQHHWDWAYEWLEEEHCHRDEWPPRMFWSHTTLPGATQATKLPGQLVRLLPRSHNTGAAILWNGFCKKHDGFSKKANGVTELNPKSVETIKKETTSTVSGGTTTYITSVGVKIPNAVFEIKHWEQPAARDDGLWDNPCWPSMLLPNDPGFALLTDDPWYGQNAGAGASTSVYNVPPPNPLTSGKTKSRTIKGRPLVAARDLGDDAIFEDGRDVTPVTYPAPAQGSDVGAAEGARDWHVFVDAMGHEYAEVQPEDVDCDQLADDLIALGQLPALSQPLSRPAVASALAELEEDKEEEATPGSVVIFDMAKPTQGLS